MEVFNFNSNQKTENEEKMKRSRYVKNERSGICRIHLALVIDRILKKTRGRVSLVTVAAGRKLYAQITSCMHMYHVKILDRLRKIYIYYCY